MWHVPNSNGYLELCSPTFYNIHLISPYLSSPTPTIYRFTSTHIYPASYAYYDDICMYISQWSLLYPSYLSNISLTLLSVFRLPLFLPRSQPMLSYAPVLKLFSTCHIFYPSLCSQEDLISSDVCSENTWFYPIFLPTQSFVTNILFPLLVSF